MRYEDTMKLNEETFRRLTGVKRKTFDKMIETLKIAEAVKRRKGGHKSKLTVEEMLLLTLEYLHEYRTYFHIAQEFGVHETTAIRICRRVEDVLKEGTFPCGVKRN